MRTKVEFLDKSIFLQDMGGTDAERGALLAAHAREQLVIARDINQRATGKPVEYDTFVDGVEGAPLESVKPNGRIVFDFHLGSEVVQYVYDLIVNASPVLRGTYKASHKIFADGVEVDSPAEAEGAAEAVILNVQPYARKIEGIRDRPPQSRQAPNGVYEVAAVMASRRFSNVARIKYTMRAPMGGASALDRWARGHAAQQSSAVRQRRQFLKDLRQPAVVISFK